MLAFSPDVYNVLKTIHILAAITWVGGAIFVQIYATRLDRQHEPARLAAFAKDVEAIGNSVFLPASILLLIMGIVLVAYTPGIEVFDLWIVLGFVGIVNTIVLGAAFIGPEAGRLGRAAEERGVEDPEVQRRIKRIFMISRFDLAVILLVVVDMVFKPGV